MGRGSSKEGQVADLQQAKESVESWSEISLLSSKDKPVVWNLQGPHPASPCCKSPDHKI